VQQSGRRTGQAWYLKIGIGVPLVIIVLHSILIQIKIKVTSFSFFYKNAIFLPMWPGDLTALLAQGSSAGAENIACGCGWCTSLV
jgi:hypothetical protein